MWNVKRNKSDRKSRKRLQELDSCGIMGYFTASHHPGQIWGSQKKWGWHTQVWPATPPTTREGSGQAWPLSRSRKEWYIAPGHTEISITLLLQIPILGRHQKNALFWERYLKPAQIKTKSPWKTAFLTRSSPFVFPNLTKTLGGGFTHLGMFFQKKAFFVAPL